MKKIVLPGEKLGVIEEMLPGEGVIEEQGELYSAYLGIEEIDQQERRVRVKPLKRMHPRRGDEIIGMVMDIKNKIALMKIFRIEKPIQVRLSLPYEGILLGADVLSVDFNDIVIGEVRGRVNGFTIVRVDINNAEHGIMLGICPRCRKVLKALGRNCLVCNNCGYIRPPCKISSRYILTE